MEFVYMSSLSELPIGRFQLKSGRDKIGQLSVFYSEKDKCNKWHLGVYTNIYRGVYSLTCVNGTTLDELKLFIDRKLQYSLAIVTLNNLEN